MKSTPSATAHRGEWEVEGYLNYLSRGTKTFNGAVAPTDNQWRFAAELETSEPRFSESFRAAEFTPILERGWQSPLVT